uniref:Cystatin domain-containing protein n=1 Tax=Sander lucioperca TaxID=283035 RepID=A0A8D0APU1_SANLU
MANRDGYGPIELATMEIQEPCDQVKTQVEEKTRKNYVEFKAYEYRRKDLVGGIPYLIKVNRCVFNIQVELLHQTKDSPLISF